MKFSILAIASLVSTVLAGYNGKAAASAIDRQSKRLKPGQYRFQNVASGKGLKYARNGQALYAAKGKGDWLSIKLHHNHIIVSPSGSNNKCVSAAWSYKKKANYYAALYACRVAKFKRDGLFTPDMETRSIATNHISFDHLEEKRDVNASSEGHTLQKRVPLREDKQMFYCHPGSMPHTWHIVAYDHIKDMPARVVSDCVVRPEWVKKNSPTRYACLVPENKKDKHQLWYIYNKQGRRV